MTDATIGFGILGSGNMARVYADALATQVEGGRFVAVALGSRAATFGPEYGAEVEESAAALLARDDVDVVVIATPHSTHRELAVEAAYAGKHIYLEKPMARTVEECDAIISAARANRVQVTVAKQTRHMEMAMKAKELIEDGAIGDVRIIRAMSPFTDFGLPAGHWLNDLGEGDCFLDWGSHACDAFRWFTGSDAKRVYADYANFGAIEARWPTAMVQIRMHSDAICQAFLSYELPEPGLGSGSNNQYLIIGAKGMIEWDLDTLRLARAEGPAAATAEEPGSMGAFVNPSRGNAEWRTVLELPSWTKPWDPRSPRRIGNTARQVQSFIGALRLGVEPRVSAEDGRAAIEMTEAASRSASTGQAVYLAPRD
ncbi:MAG: Gfo/Idh/MocA family oxidoreductase [Chloroflexota bacterium]